MSIKIKPIKTRLAAIAVAALAATGSIASTTTPAEAHGFHHHWGVGAGLIGAAVIGSAIAANDGYYYHGYRRCGWAPQYDAFGRYVGRIRTCY
jgi:hypothetical protein